MNHKITKSKNKEDKYKLLKGNLKLIKFNQTQKNKEFPRKSNNFMKKKRIFKIQRIYQNSKLNNQKKN